MEYFTIDNRKVIIDDSILSNFINNGEYGNVYRYNENQCIKIYNDKDFKIKYFLTTYLFNTLKEITSTNLVSIDELLYKNNKYEFKADAYIMKYYQEIYKNILLMPSDYLIENIENLFVLSKELSKRHIILDDLKKDNTIFTEDKIVLIDPEHYILDKNISQREILHINNSTISCLFNQITLNELKKYYNNQISAIYTDKLFPVTTRSNTQIKVLSKRLSTYKSPIDYINANRR